MGAGALQLESDANGDVTATVEGADTEGANNAAACSTAREGGTCVGSGGGECRGATVVAVRGNFGAMCACGEKRATPADAYMLAADAVVGEGEETEEAEETEAGGGGGRAKGDCERAVGEKSTEKGLRSSEEEGGGADS